LPIALALGVDALLAARRARVAPAVPARVPS
jgi:hypothetical protein